MNSHVIFKESIQLGNVHEVRKKLLEIINSDESVSIKIDSSNIPDLAGIQLLASLYRCVKKDTKFKICINDELKGSFLRYGFNCLANN
ncbi:MAG: hypothetical protein JJU28_00595 [Cyclobacteriaceae bacterium]|nr:hypothetical protein [Cyclobacteriaceae bacterium]